MIYDLIIKRLNKIDVKINGWILDCTLLGNKFIKLFEENFFDYDLVLKFTNDLKKKKLNEFEQLFQNEGEDIEDTFNWKKTVLINQGMDYDRVVYGLVQELIHIND